MLYKLRFGYFESGRGPLNTEEKRIIYVEPPFPFPFRPFWNTSIGGKRTNDKPAIYFSVLFASAQIEIP
jgi:hypothetical protein